MSQMWDTSTDVNHRQQQNGLWINTRFWDILIFLFFKLLPTSFIMFQQFSVSRAFGKHAAAAATVVLRHSHKV